MADHEIVWTFDGSSARVEAEARCNAGPDAPCRMMPTCNCEEWDALERDKQGYFHRAGGNEDGEIHRHDRPDDCNTCTWLNDSDILECTGSFTLELAVTPINPIWVGPGYDWEPIRSETGAHAFQPEIDDGLDERPRPWLWDRGPGR